MWFCFALCKVYWQRSLLELGYLPCVLLCDGHSIRVAEGSTRAVREQIVILDTLPLPGKLGTQSQITAAASLSMLCLLS